MLTQIDISSGSDHNTNLVVDYFRQLGSEAYNPWVMLIELLLIGVVVYCTLRFLQGTRGARLMRGIGVVVVASFVVVRILAERFGWERIEFLYQYFVLAVFLITLVVFQPELRRGLMRIGERLWFTSMYRLPDKVIGPLIMSVSALSKKHIGAIIAIERVSGLGAIIETGVRLDAKLSADLLNTIFWPGSALHDMGVMIRQDRIVAAGCQFPLAEAVDLERGLGSRHRAALGLSEESDAIIVVVSEETGSISLASDGELHRALSVEVLQTMLYELLLRRQRLAPTGIEPKLSEGAGPPATEPSTGEPEEELCSK